MNTMTTDRYKYVVESGYSHFCHSTIELDEMEKANLAKRQQQFQEQFTALDGELRALQGTAVQQGETEKQANHLRLLELQYNLGQLCTEYSECKLACLYFQRLLDDLKQNDKGSEATANSESEQIFQKEIVELRVNVLNCLSALHFQSGNQAKAMELLLEAKQIVREHLDIAGISLLEKPLIANYALFLHSKGNVQGAIHVAKSIVEANSSSPGVVEGVADPMGDAACATAYLLLSTCSRDKDEQSPEALVYAERAVMIADTITDESLKCRASNNIALLLFERGKTVEALPYFVAAYRSSLKLGDPHLQAIMKYHVGLAIARVDEKEAKTIRDTIGGFDSIPDDCLGDDGTTVGTLDRAENSDNPSQLQNESASTHFLTLVEGTPTAPIAPKDWFLQSDGLAGALSEPDMRLAIVAHGSRGEEEYYSGEFHTAEAEFTIALKRLRELTNQSSSNTDKNEHIGDDDAVVEELEPLDIVAAREMDPELAKLQGFLLSYVGCTQLVEGRFELAKRSHQRDLALALEREDVHAQQRALRNLAMVFNSTQRYRESIPLWRDALEIATVLQSKCDQMMALSGLGTALKELQILERGCSGSTLTPTNNEAEADASLQAPPLPIFIRQRALAVEVGDRHQHILAQRHIVSVYESHTEESAVKSESRGGESTTEKWLAECDTLVRLCDQYDNLQYRADAYRSLANALTAQLTRLRSRSAARFADAIAVLVTKRDAVCAKYLDTTAALAMATAVVFDRDNDTANTFDPKERQPRPSVTRADVFSRR